MFARSYSAGAQALGWELDYLMDETIKAMQELEKAQFS
jgi:hypothetical protein